MKIRIFALVMALSVMLCSAALAAEGTITLDGSTITTDCDAVTVEGSVATITAPGDYTVTGTLDNGQIIVNITEEGKTTLTLKDVSINCTGAPAIYVQQSQKRVTLDLAENSVNKISGGVAAVPADDDPTPIGVIYSKSNLTISGVGQLIVKADGVDGIVSKDDLRIKDGTVTVTAPRHGIRGKDSVEISGGTVTVDAGKDGIKTTSTKDSDHGYISITGGLVSVSCGDEPFSFVTRLSVTDGMVVASIKTAE